MDEALRGMEGGDVSRDGNDGLDDAGFGAGKSIEFFDDRIEVGPMRDPGIGIDGPVFNEPDDPSEVTRQGVARTLERQFGTVY